MIKSRKKRPSPPNPFLHRVNSTLLIKRKWFRKVVILTWVLFFIVIIGLPLYVYAVIRNPYDLFGGMPSLRDVENPENDLSSEVISADGVSLGRYFLFNRSQVTYDELPEMLVSTLLISEDHRFYSHPGLDLWSFLRVFYGIVTFSSQGGGSTLTQQTAKNLYSTRGNELQGKLARAGAPVELLISKTKEWIIGVQLERNFTKQEIIALYLNTVSFNKNAYGIKVAAETYFQKGLHELTLDECALLVGMLQGTYRFNPVDFPERALRKRNEVIDKLFVHNYIKTPERRDSLKAIPIKLNFALQDHNAGLAPYFVQNILRPYLEQWCKDNGYNLVDAGLKIHVTLDSRIQRFAEIAMAEHLRTVQKEFDDAWTSQDPWVDSDGAVIPGFIEHRMRSTSAYRKLVARYGPSSDSVAIELNRKKTMKVFTWRGERDTVFSSFDSLRYYKRFLHSGLMAMNPLTGEVKAWVGGINFKYFNYDHVHQGKRQAGSIFKPFVYGKAIEDGYSPCLEKRDISPDINIGGDIYRPRNFDGTYGSGNAYTLRQALARSLNTITVDLVDELHPQNVVDFARKLGITSRLDPVPSLGLGTSDVALDEMVAAYSSFVNLGTYTQPFYLARIEDKHGNVVANFVPRARQVMDEHSAYTMVHMLKGGVEEEGGTSGSLTRDVLDDNEVGGKTGTTTDAADGWYIGITHNLVTGVWIGGDEPSIHLPPGLGSGSRSALPLWNKFMTQLYAHPEVQYHKGKFRMPMEELKINLDCDRYTLPID